MLDLHTNGHTQGKHRLGLDNEVLVLQIHIPPATPKAIRNSENWFKEQIKINLNREEGIQRKLFGPRTALTIHHTVRLRQLKASRLPALIDRDLPHANLVLEHSSRWVRCIPVYHRNPSFIYMTLN